jgi:arylsulfatase A-like enzyme
MTTRLNHPSRDRIGGNDRRSDTSLDRTLDRAITRNVTRSLVAIVFIIASGITPGNAFGQQNGQRDDSPGRAVSRPNVVLVMTDDQGYGDLGCHGNEMIRTPNLDQLHRESVRFTDFHVDPTCSPTRAALMTGRYSTRTGVWHTVMGRSLMYDDEVTMADVFSSAGYRTGIFGKWHLGDNYPMRPRDRGFDHWVIHGGGGIGQTPDFWGNRYIDDHYQTGESGEDRWQPFEGYCTDVFFDEAIRFIDRPETEPFFVYLATNVPHSPYIVPENYKTHYLKHGVAEPMASFYGMIENCDQNIGRLVEHLNRTGRADNTIFIFMTDNGTAAGISHNAAGSGPETWLGFNAAMRGAKGSPYEGGHRVPLFVRWPAGGIGGGDDGGRDVDALTAHIDLMPTLVELCGLPFEPTQKLDGTSLASLLRPAEDDDSDRPLSARPPRGNGSTGAAARFTQRTLFVHTQREEVPPKWRSSSVMSGKWRLVNGSELYDLSADPGQADDVAARHADVVARLRDEYETWWQSLQPAFSRYGYIRIGTEHENPVRFTCMDWHAPTVQEIPWDQSQIDRMPAVNGWWMIDVASAGRYRVTLRHKPPQAEFPLRATRATIRLGDCEVTTDVEAGATEVTLEIDLPTGPVRLETELTDEKSRQSRGAFFVEIHRVAD